MVPLKVNKEESPEVPSRVGGRGGGPGQGPEGVVSRASRRILR